MLKKLLISTIKKAGYEITKRETIKKLPSDFEIEHKNILQKAGLFTMTSPERIYGLIEAVKYISKHKIEGDIVECGVWKGGSMLAVAETLFKLNDTKRQLYLYDTFEGMPPPSGLDKNYQNISAAQLLSSNKNKDHNMVWAYSSLDEVKTTMSLTQYPIPNIHYIAGKVEDTIPGTIPSRIALLRLDTDWYESTKWELVHLFPLLVKGGVLIIDDYGFWKGAKKAVDEYFEETNIQVLLNRMDETGRIAVKQ